MEETEEIEDGVELLDAQAKRAMETLMQMADQELAKLLLKKVLATLIANIDQGLATASDLNVARALLKDNNIGIVPTRTNAAGLLADKLKEQQARALEAPGVTAPDQLQDVSLEDFVERYN